MRITVLTVPGCPNAEPAVERVRAALAGRAAEVELVEVHGQGQATALGMTGSPTILLDGTDPFAPAGAVPSVSCRLYRDADGTVSGTPSQAALRAAIDGAGVPQTTTVPGDCCETEALDAVGRGGRGRRAPAERGLRAVHQAVLRHFAATGTAPEPSSLEPVAATAGRTAGQVLAELAREDFLTLDERGHIRAAYPFSATPTRHRVGIEGGAEVWSMCAIDALGIPAMLGRDAVITSSDPVTGEPVTVTAHGKAMAWEPPGAVVFVGQRPGGGPAATACCDALNFFTSQTTARTWTTAHPEVPGRIVDRARAEEIAAQTFGPLLAP
ncbi:alkylmercury lyase family protein [Streptomyces sp. NBC_00059]|uniref:alkylmercury lyase family protein n=1 Tax=Streptomyces sp. NBC_00059 TaxID=2975635 RepID=UPI002254BC89|nr:alkylmercury lyase family protein [Streptomyces sp. NBC_00059]MCX5418070.1 alkylmercury lyase family protein [Streptomyces sp. NBC_00059]